MAINFDMVKAVRDWMDGKDWKYTYIEDKNVIKTGTKVDCKIKSLDIFYTFHPSGFNVTAICPVSADEDTMKEVLRYLTMANYGLNNGCFELDVNDGEIRFKVYVSCRGLSSLPEDMCEESLLVPIIMMEKYGNGIAALCMGFSDSDTEIKKAEGGD